MQAGHASRFLQARSRRTRRRGIVRIATMLAIPMLLSLLVGALEMTRLLAGMTGKPGAVELRTRIALSVTDSNSQERTLVTGRP